MTVGQDQLLASLGIDPEYVDARGARRVVPAETIQRLVAAMGGEEVSAPAKPLEPPPAARPAYQLNDAQERLWVLAVQLYSVRSRRNWGIGDFGDLRELIALAARVGAAGIGLNPLHALFDDVPEQASPYSPNSRLFLNPLYIDVAAVPDCSDPILVGMTDTLAKLRAAEIVDYTGVAAAKSEALQAAYARFQSASPAERQDDFAAFRRERGAALERFAAFEVLRRRFRRVWWDWPDEWRNPDGAALARLASESADEIGYYAYLQWLADRQLGRCQDLARQLGMPVGLYIDLAVGVEPGGADAWGQQDAIIPQVEIGAPPDLLNTAGQAWGLAAFNPRALAADAFVPFADVLSAAMRHAGAIRLDHVLGLNRLFLIPLGLKPQDGAYVRYPLQAMLAVVAEQSHAHRCVVIGEDLGTVPDELRAALVDWGIWSYLVMLFERDKDGAFLPPAKYRREALVTFSTHDLPTFAGWRTAHDLGVKRALGIDPGESDDERETARLALREAFGHAGLSRHWELQITEVAKYLAQAPSRMMVISIEDVLGMADQPNVPGTVTEHPNWRQRLPVNLEELEAHPQLRALAQVMRDTGRGISPMDDFSARS